MQLHIISPLIIYPLWKIKNKKGKTAYCIFWLVVAFVIPFSVTWAKDFPINSRRTREEYEGNWFMWMYHAPWMKFPSFIPGIITGLLLHETRGKKIKRLNWVNIKARNPKSFI